MLLFSRIGCSDHACPPETNQDHKVPFPMTRHMPIPLNQAFVPVDAPSFGRLINRVSDARSLSETRKRDMISGLRRVADALGLPPDDVPCDGRWLQPRLSKINAPMIGMKPKTWQNAVSNARAAMAHFGIVEHRRRLAEDLDRFWRPLWDEVLISGDRTLPTALRRFIHFLNRMSVHPSNVCDEHAIAYREALVLNEISKDPEAAYRAAVNGWNLASERLSNWPSTRLSLPRRAVRIALDVSAFPVSFTDDVETVLNKLAKPDPFDEAAPSTPRRPATIKQYRHQIMRFASHLANSGLAVEAITSLETVLDPLNAKQGLREMLERNDGATSRGISQTAALLRNLARLTGLPDDQREALANLARKVARPAQNGMTDRNRARLRVLQDPQHKNRFLMLPEHLFSKYSPTTQRAKMNALAREDALAIAILLVCPIRVGSLAGINLSKHIQRPGDGRVFLVLEEEDTKTGRSIEFVLPADVVVLLDKHLATRCPYLCPAGTQFLFPKRDGSASIGPSELSSRISKRIRRETGLEVNAHLFRHFAVMNWLDANPGGYEVARRLLGHSDLSHTINLYSGLEVTSATKAFSDLVSDLREGYGV